MEFGQPWVGLRGIQGWHRFDSDGFVLFRGFFFGSSGKGETG
jgi:hypothetical protein